MAKPCGLHGRSPPEAFVPYRYQYHLHPEGLPGGPLTAHGLFHEGKGIGPE
jgi:hypothetical protein